MKRTKIEIKSRKQKKEKKRKRKTADGLLRLDADPGNFPAEPDKP